MTATRAGLRAGFAYGALAFLAGAALGPVRELALAPRIGGMAAALAEAVAMGALLWFAARFALARLLADGAGWRPRAAMATTGLAVVVAAEATLGAVFAASGLATQRAPRSAAEQAVGLALLAWLVALPFLLRRGAG
ncbi:MAG: hypothetical protein IRZ13_06440 [Acetobacteraceae bacterium]|nr:hypothetical protein [Acetobacteraceae bacterium]